MSLIDLSRFNINEIQSTMPNGSVTKPEEDENANKKVSYTDDEEEQADPEAQDATDYTIPQEEESPTETEEEDEPVDYTIPDDNSEEEPPTETEEPPALPPPDNNTEENPDSSNIEPQSDDEEEENDLTEPDPQAGVDYTVPDEDNNEENDGEIDYTTDVNTDGGTNGGEEGEAPSEPTDYTAGDSGENTEDSETTGSTGDADYTSDANGDESEGDDGYYTDDGADTSDTGDESGGEVDSELKQLEDELFSSLTPEQIAIKEKTLKEQFMELYQSTIDITEKIKLISKTKENSRILEFVTIKLMELKDLIYFTVTKSYQTKTFIENITLFQQCLAACNTINQLLQEAIPEFKNETINKSS